MSILISTGVTLTDRMLSERELAYVSLRWSGTKRGSAWKDWRNSTVQEVPEGVQAWPPVCVVCDVWYRYVCLYYMYGSMYVYVYVYVCV
jgi:hypothetical protein